MANGNGQNEEKPRVKKCPFFKEYCIKERCAIYAEMKRNVGGLQEKFGMCPFTAIVVILSEMNIKMQPPQQMIKLPDNLLRR